MTKVTSRELTISYYAAAAEAAGRDIETITTSAQTLGELRAQIVECYGERMGQLVEVSAYLLGDELVRDPATPLGGHASVEVLPPFAGG